MASYSFFHFLKRNLLIYENYYLLGFKEMVCITWRKKQTTTSWRQPRENCKTEWQLSVDSLLYRVQKELRTESLALLFSADSPSGPFIVLEICILFCWLHRDRSHSLSPWGSIFNTWMADSSFSEYLFHLLVFCLFFIAFFFLSFLHWVALRNFSCA